MTGRMEGWWRRESDGDGGLSVCGFGWMGILWGTDHLNMIILSYDGEGGGWVGSIDPSSIHPSIHPSIDQDSKEGG
jgi:hypothetical protein